MPPIHDDLGRGKIFFEQTDKLIAKLGMDVSNAKTPANGSGRYKAVCLAYEQLNILYQVRNQFLAKWQKTEVDGRNGEYLMEKLWELKKDLQGNREGNPTGSDSLNKQPDHPFGL